MWHLQCFLPHQGSHHPPQCLLPHDRSHHLSNLFVYHDHTGQFQPRHLFYPMACYLLIQLHLDENGYPRVRAKHVLWLQYTIMQSQKSSSCISSTNTTRNLLRMSMFVPPAHHGTSADMRQNLHMTMTTTTMTMTNTTTGGSSHNHASSFTTMTQQKRHSTIPPSFHNG